MPNKLIAQTTSYGYTGAVQSFTVPTTGTYRLEVWGAQGGSGESYTISKGGYAKGEVNLVAGTVLYVYVGGSGNYFTYGTSTHSTAVSTYGGWNGGGGVYNSAASHGTGGGATDISIVNGTVSTSDYNYIRSSTSYLNRIIVAGGGGGNGNWENSVYAGGGTDGIGSSGAYGTQTAAGTAAVAGAFGYGGRGSGNSGGGSGGGGGWYGGGGASGGSGSGGGGSGYVLTTSSTKPTGYVPTASYYMTNSELIAGNAVMPNPSGGTMIGRTGHGYAVFTLLCNTSTPDPTASAQSFCSSSNPTISNLTTNSGTNIKWYSSLTGSALATSTALSSGTYYVESTGINSGSTIYCPSSRVAVVITVNNVTSVTVPPSTSIQNLCIGATPNDLSVTATGASLTYQWYQNSTASNTGGTLISGAVSNTYTPPTTSVGTNYYYCIVSGTCSGNVTTATSAVSGAININALPIAGTATASVNTLCTGNNTSLTLSGSSGTIQWQQSANNSTWSNVTSGTGSTTATYTTPNLTSTTFYRAVLSSGVCSSVNSNTLTITVNSLPVVSANTGSTYICGVSNSISLSNATTGGVGVWSSSNTSIATINSSGVVTGVAFGNATITYTVTDNNSCVNTSSTSIAVNSVPATPTSLVATPATLCNPGTAILSATSSGNNINWYDVSTGGTILSTVASGVNYTTASISSNKTFYAEAAFSTSQTFSYTGSTQTYTVPAGVTSLSFELWGAQGGTGNTNVGGKGGYAKGTYQVTPGSIINIYVGGRGTAVGNNVLGGAGWNGGGNAQGSSGGGGGASDIRIGGTALSNRVIVAGGGGGAGYYSNLGGQGGGANGLTGGNATNSTAAYGGGGGTQSAGGATGGGTYPGAAGALGVGGDAGKGSGYIGYSGGGGGGYYGGGGGSGAVSNGSGYGAGGGGGSSYIGTSGLTNTQTIAGNSSMPNPAGGANITGKDLDGVIIISAVSNPCLSPRVPISVNMSTPASAGTVTGAATICAGATSTYTATSVVLAGGTSAWSSSNTNVATVNTSTGLITSVAAGTSTITYTITGGCGGTTTAQKQIIINALPTIQTSGATTGVDLVNLTATGGVTYVWSGGSATNSSTNSFDASGEYAVTGTNANGCTSTINFNVLVQHLGLKRNGKKILDSASQISVYGKIGSLNPVSFYGKRNAYKKSGVVVPVNLISTNNIASITGVSAISGGYISSDASFGISARGVVWATSSGPTINNSKTTDGNGTGAFTSSITGLSSNTTYYIRAYATNSFGTSYGPELSFTTLP